MVALIITRALQLATVAGAAVAGMQYAAVVDMIRTGRPGQPPSQQELLLVCRHPLSAPH